MEAAKTIAERAAIAGTLNRPNLFIRFLTPSTLIVFPGECPNG
jgi:hypothetical protein